MGKDMLEKLKAYLDSDEGKKNTEEYFEKLAHKNVIYDSQLVRFHEKYDDRFVEILEKYINKYDSDEYVNKCYSRGYEPSTPMLFFFFDYAQKYGREVTDAESEKYANIFTGDMAYIHDYVFNKMYGQGCVIQVYKIKMTIKELILTFIPSKEIKQRISNKQIKLNNIPITDMTIEVDFNTSKFDELGCFLVKEIVPLGKILKFKNLGFDFKDFFGEHDFENTSGDSPVYLRPLRDYILLTLSKTEMYVFKK